MRAADADECVAAGGSPEQVLAASRAASDFTFTETHAGSPLASWGWRARADGGADVWMLSFEGIEGRKLYAAARSRQAVKVLLEEFEFLQCEVHATHTLAMQWLGWLGFRTVHVKTSPVGGTFNVMERRRWGA